MMDFCSDVCFHLQLGLNNKKEFKKCIPDNLLLLKCKKGPNWIFLVEFKKIQKIWLIFSVGTLWQKLKVKYYIFEIYSIYDTL